MGALNVGILGTGNMGKQIAILCAVNGIGVYLWNHVAKPETVAHIQQLAHKQARLAKSDKVNVQQICDNIHVVDRMKDLTNCKFIIEAVKEDIVIKSLVLSELNTMIEDDKVVFTNTSTLSITSLASLFVNPARFIGVHFFNPLFSLKLVEVVKGEYTSENTVNQVIEFLSLLQRHPVILPETPGFIVNRLLFPMINEAVFLLAEGVADAKTIDSCMKQGANHPMGPLELADLIGLDVCLSILETLVAETGDDKYRPAPLLRKQVRAGKFGRKSGVGFYTYRTKGL